MANDDLLHQFKKLLEENNKQQDENLQKRLEENNKQIRKEIKSEVDLLHERMDAQREQIASVERNLSGQISAAKAEITHDVANLVSDTLIPLYDEQEAKITELQKAVGLRPKQ